MKSVIVRNLFLLAFTLGGVWMAAPAQATALVVCTGTAEVNYSPGITSQPVLQQADVDIQLPLCIRVPALLSPTSASASMHLQTLASCENLLGTSQGVSTLTWADGATTTYSWTADDVLITRLQAQTIVARTAKVVAGRYLGMDAVEETVLLNTELDGCLTDGVEQLNGSLTLQIATPLLP